MGQISLQDDWGLLTGSPEGVMTIFFVVIVLLGAIKYFFGDPLWRWLKGSRTGYYIERGTETTKDRVISVGSAGFRTACCYDPPGTNKSAPVIDENDPAIQINYGPVLRGGTVYNPRLKSGFWSIESVQQYGGIDWVKLVVKGNGLSRVDHAVQLIDKYPQGLYDMLDRIADLEKELETANSRQDELLAGAFAVLFEINDDKQRYRSPAAEHIRECIGVITSWALKKQVPSVDMINVWRKLFPACKE